MTTPLFRELTNLDVLPFYSLPSGDHVAHYVDAWRGQRRESKVTQTTRCITYTCVENALRGAFARTLRLAIPPRWRCLSPKLKNKELGSPLLDLPRELLVKVWHINLSFPCPLIAQSLEDFKILASIGSVWAFSNVHYFRRASPPSQPWRPTGDALHLVNLLQQGHRYSYPPSWIYPISMDILSIWSCGLPGEFIVLPMGFNDELTRYLPLFIGIFHSEMRGRWCSVVLWNQFEVL